MSEDLTWVCGETIGVPFLLCPARVAQDWEGCKEPINNRVVEAIFRFDGPDSVATDYDRACDAADDYYNSIQIGTNIALVLGEEIPAATWISSDKFVGGYVVIRVMLPAENPDYSGLLEELPHSFFSDTEIVLECSDEGFLLFPSTQSPHDEYFQFAEAVCPAGFYNVSFGIYRQVDSFDEPETEIRIFEVRKQN